MDFREEEILPVMHIDEIPREESPRRWLIEGLWGASAVGVIGGSPKTAKTWLALDMAISVATNTPCVGNYRVKESGRALIYLAEDTLQAMKERVESVVRHRQLKLSQVDLHAITAETLRLDHPHHCNRLEQTVRFLRPRLLLLDPLVRLHRLNENDAKEISGLLSFLRDLQRRFDVAVILVHHARKSGLAGPQAGQGLRGSSDIWAWSDSNLYLRRIKDKFLLSMEHRSSPAPQPVSLQLVDTDQQTIHLEVVSGYQEEKEAEDSLEEAVIAQLTKERGVTRTELRSQLRVKNERLGKVLEKLQRENHIAHDADGWRLSFSTDC